MIDLQRHGLEDKWPKFAKLQEEVAGLERSRAEAESALVAASHAIPAAQERDAEAAAKAIRASKSVPDGRHEAKARAALEDAQRTSAAYAKALEDARAELAAFIAKHRAALFADIAAARQSVAARVSESAAQLLKDYGHYEDLAGEAKRLAPPPPPPDETAPAQKLSTTIIGPVATHRAAGPERGHIEQMLSYLASLAPESGAHDDAA